MRIDYHTHHVRCGHATGTLEEYVQQAIQLGIQQLGLSDHMPLIHVDPETYPFDGMAMPMDELPRYVEECLHLKEKYKDQIDLRIGLEGDYIEGFEEEIERIVTSYPWDYVIGSVHFLGEWDITDYRQVDGWEGRDADETYALYYQTVQKAARTGFYDFIGHIDVIKRFGKKPKQDMSSLERETLTVIKEQDVAIELNTSGLRMPVQEMFPSQRILETCYELGIPLTIGSDAHQPAQLAFSFDEAVRMLKTIGFQQLATFQGRARVMVDLNE